MLGWYPPEAAFIPDFSAGTSTTPGRVGDRIEVRRGIREREDQLRHLATFFAMLVLAAGCGGGKSAGSGEDVEGVLDALVARAGAGTAVAACTGLDEPGTGRPGKGPALPDLDLRCLEGGEETSLRDLRGPMLLNVWASWCGPCKDEVPYLIEANQALGAKVRFAAIALADEDLASQQWMSFHGVTWPSLADPDGRIRRPLRVPGPPVTLFVAKDGTVAGTHYGAFTSTAQVREKIAEHLGVAG